MKKLIIYILTLLGSITNIAYSQTIDSNHVRLLHWITNGDTSINVIVNESYNYIDTAQSDIGQSYAKKFGRWYNFWASRYDSSGYTNRTGAKMLEFIKNADQSQLICSDGGDWT